MLAFFALYVRTVVNRAELFHQVPTSLVPEDGKIFMDVEE
jgi:hypothetical protein